MKECTKADKQYRYNYVFIGADDDYIRAMYGELEKLSNVHFNSYGLDSKNPILRAVFKLHWSAQINRIVHLPFKRIWFSKMCRNKFRNDKPVCYIFMGGQYVGTNPKLRDYIRQLNPKNRIVIHYEDLISKKKYTNFETVRKSADYIITYDSLEAKEYGIKLFNLPVYSTIQAVTKAEAFKYDVYFLGFAKDRLDLIHSIYQKLSNDGLKCYFHICGVTPEQQIAGEGLHYGSPITYAQNISNVQKAKCILEVMQGGSDAITLRTQEALCYRRKLLTNHKAVAEQPYYSPEIISTFSDAEEIDTSFIQRPVSYSTYDNAFDFSPEQYLRFVELLIGE